MRNRSKQFIASIIFAVGMAGCAVCQASVAPPKDFKVSFIPKPWEVNVERDYMMLDKGWKFFKGAPLRISSFDTVVEGISNPKNYVLRDGTKAQIGTACEKPEAPECDDSSWITVNVPFNWSDLGPEMDEFIGTTWYRKTITIAPEQLKGKAILNFWGVYYRAFVYLNDEKVGMHEGGYTPFSFDITSRLKPGRNTLAVKVDNSIGPDDIVIGDWWNYGGIHREAFIEFTDKARIVSFIIKPNLSADFKSGTAQLTARVDGGGEKSVTFHIYRLNGENKVFLDSVSAKVDASGVASAKWGMTGAAMWSPESPNLYFVKAELISNSKPVDGLGDMFGFRKFEVRGKELYLNGQRVFFRAVNRHDEFYHGEFPDAGRVMTEQERIGDFKLIKEMNGNAMRTAHYPNHPYNYYITDRLGIMTVEEGGPVGGRLNDDVVIEKLKTQLREMFERDRNRASILIWSIGNEFGGDTFLKYIKTASEYMRSLDDRALTFTETAGRETKQGYNYVDILSRNEYVGWYGVVPQDPSPRMHKEFIVGGVNALLDQYHGEYPDKPIFIMETGAESICGQHAANPEKKLMRGDEEYQVSVLKNQFETVTKRDYVAGFFPWVFADFKTRSSGGTCQFTPHLNRKGLICADHHTTKAAYKLMTELYGEMTKKQ
jgi:beta-glucuronidase